MYYSHNLQLEVLSKLPPNVAYLPTECVNNIYHLDFADRNAFHLSAQYYMPSAMHDAEMEYPVILGKSRPVWEQPSEKSMEYYLTEYGYTHSSFFTFSQGHYHNKTTKGCDVLKSALYFGDYEIFTLLNVKSFRFVNLFFLIFF